MYKIVQCFTGKNNKLILKECRFSYSLKWNCQCCRDDYIYYPDGFGMVIFPEKNFTLKDGFLYLCKVEEKGTCGIASEIEEVKIDRGYFKSIVFKTGDKELLSYRVKENCISYEDVRQIYRKKLEEEFLFPVIEAFKENKLKELQESLLLKYKEIFEESDTELRKVQLEPIFTDVEYHLTLKESNTRYWNLAPISDEYINKIKVKETINPLIKYNEFMDFIINRYGLIVEPVITKYDEFYNDMKVYRKRTDKNIVFNALGRYIIAGHYEFLTLAFDNVEKVKVYWPLSNYAYIKIQSQKKEVIIHPQYYYVINIDNNHIFVDETKNVYVAV